MRIAQSKKCKNEKEKFWKENGMCIVLAKNGYAVEYLEDIPSSYDIHLNGIKADLKKTKSHNNMVNYAKEAIREQGAEMVVFELVNMTHAIQKELYTIKKLDIPVMYFTSGKRIVTKL